MSNIVSCGVGPTLLRNIIHSYRIKAQSRFSQGPTSVQPELDSCGCSRLDKIDLWTWHGWRNRMLQVTPAAQPACFSHGNSTGPFYPTCTRSTEIQSLTLLASASWTSFQMPQGDFQSKGLVGGPVCPTCNSQRSKIMLLFVERPLSIIHCCREWGTLRSSFGLQSTCIAFVVIVLTQREGPNVLSLFASMEHEGGCRLSK